MEKCINCNKNETDRKYEFYVVRTYKTKENNKRIKKDEIAGNIYCYLCENCLSKYISNSGNIFKSTLRTCFIPFLLLAMSLVTAFLGKDTEGSNSMVSGVIFSVVAIYCLYTGFIDAKKKADAINSGMTNKFKRKLITELIVINLPSKDKKGKLAYIMTDRVMNDNFKELSEETGISEEMLAKIKRLKKNEEKSK